MKRCAGDIQPTAEVVAEQVDRPLVNGTGYPVIDGGPREHPISRVSDVNRGLVRKAVDALLHLVSGRRFGDTFADRQRD